MAGLLEARDISIVFGGLRAVDDFSCALEKGELVGLIGPNGAGKTTVFNMLSGVYTPTEGEIDFWDRNRHVHSVGKMKSAALKNRFINAEEPYPVCASACPFCGALCGFA